MREQLCTNPRKTHELVHKNAGSITKRPQAVRGQKQKASFYSGEY